MTRRLIPLMTLFAAAVAGADHHIPGEQTTGVDCTDVLNQVIYPECQVIPQETEGSCVAVFHTDAGSLEIAWADVAGAGYAEVVLDRFPTGPLDFRLSTAQPADAASAPADATCRSAFDTATGVVTIPRVELRDAGDAVSATYANVRLQLRDAATLLFEVTGADPVQ